MLDGRNGVFTGFKVDVNGMDPIKRFPDGKNFEWTRNGCRYQQTGFTFKYQRIGLRRNLQWTRSKLEHQQTGLGKNGSYNNINPIKWSLTGEKLLTGLEVNAVSNKLDPLPNTNGLGSEETSNILEVIANANELGLEEQKSANVEVDIKTY